MKDLLLQLIGQYNPVQISNDLYIDIPFTICGLLIIVVIYALIRGVIYIICRQH